MMRHQFNTSDLRSCNKTVFYQEFDRIATPAHYKAIYEIQKVKGVSLYGAFAELLNNNQFSSLMVSHFNDKANYSRILSKLCTNGEVGEDLIIPDRECDFAVSLGDDDDNGYFWIEERVCLLKNSDEEIMLGRILSDSKHNNILIKTFEDNGFEEYLDNKGSTFRSKVARAYKEFLADMELLDNAKN